MIRVLDLWRLFGSSNDSFACIYLLAALWIPNSSQISTCGASDPKMPSKMPPKMPHRSKTWIRTWIQDMNSCLCIHLQINECKWVMSRIHLQDMNCIHLQVKSCHAFIYKTWIAFIYFAFIYLYLWHDSFAFIYLRDPKRRRQMNECKWVMSRIRHAYEYKYVMSRICEAPSGPCRRDPRRRKQRACSSSPWGHRALNPSPARDPVAYRRLSFGLAPCFLRGPVTWFIQMCTTRSDV